MTLSPPPRAEVYLVKNSLRSIATRAALELTDDHLRCTVAEYSRWVESAQRAGRPRVLDDVFVSLGY